jgi:Tfp pilus assembly protein PilF
VQVQKRIILSNMYLGALAVMLLLVAAGCRDQGDPGQGQTAGPTGGEPPRDTEDGAPPDRATADAATATLDPDLAPIFDLISQEQLGPARDRVTDYLQQNPQTGQAQFLLGLTYHREKRYALARPHFAKATEFSPQFHPTYHFYGWCLYYLGETERARTAFREHVRLAPTEGDSHFALGLLAMDADQLDEAERRFRKAIELQADNPMRRRDVAKAHARLGDLYIRRERLELAKGHLLDATTLWPQHYAAYYKLHLVLNRLGEPEAAQEAFQQYRLWQERAEQRRGLPGQGR